VNLQSQLDSLKTQINPHFLFNNLNSLSSLITSDAQQAELLWMNYRRFTGIYFSRITVIFVRLPMKSSLSKPISICSKPVTATVFSCNWIWTPVYVVSYSPLNAPDFARKRH
jgi:hypothetical protein